MVHQRDQGSLIVAASSSKFPDIAHLQVVTAYQSDISLHVQGIFMGLDLFGPPKIFGRPNEI